MIVAARSRNEQGYDLLCLREGSRKESHLPRDNEEKMDKGK